MFLGPEIAIFLVDYFFLKGKHYRLAELTKVRGAYWYTHGINWIAVASWLLGVAAYWGLKQVPAIATTTGATFIAMAITAAIYGCGMRLTKAQPVTAK